MSQTLLLTNNEYVHILDNNTGIIRLVEGPYSGPLTANEKIFNQVNEKIVLKANEYCVILNPIHHEKKTLQAGEREVRKGPIIFSLHPGEIIEGEITAAFSLAENQGIYIQNRKTGEVRLELGPKEVILQAEETLYHHKLTEKELKAMGVSLTDYKPYLAVRIDLDENQVIQLVDDTVIRYELGPKTIFLKPYEHPKVLTISGDTPKRPDVINTAIVRLGPDFLSDILNVRTKDNADLQIFVRYKWRFSIDVKNLAKVFSINDFIGYASETIASMLRGIAAQHNFEVFHTNAADIIKKVIFADTTEGEGRIFENGFTIFSVDIKQITPVDPIIANKLNAAISNNMDIYVKKNQQQAELDARRQYIEAEKVIEQQRAELIVVTSNNYEKEVLEEAKINADTQIEQAKGNVQSELIKAEKQLKADTERTTNLIDLLKDNATNYLKQEEYTAFSNADRSVIVPNDAKIWLPIEENTKKHRYDADDEEQEED